MMPMIMDLMMEILVSRDMFMNGTATEVPFSSCGEKSK
jgi:hypothetical protein